MRDATAVTDHLKIESRAPRVGRLRWLICFLLFLATTLNYMDRQILGILAAPLQLEIGWSEAQYGLIVTAFQASYAIGLLGIGRVIDRIGTRAGYSITVAFWSAAAALHGAASKTVHFAVARFALGLGEAGNFPAAVKTVAEWFPRRERAFAIGLFNCGSNVGAIITPLLVPWIALHLGWRWAFILTGVSGVFWLVAWLALYRPPEKHPRLSRAELEYITSDADPPTAPAPWRQLLAYRQTWALVIARFLTDPVWWFYLYWTPKYLHAKHGLTLDQVGLPLVIIYLAADGGSIFGGWLSSSLIKRGWSVNAARKIAILACALMVTPMVLGSQFSTAWMAVAALSFAAAGHQGWAANMFASISDMFPPHAVSSVVGIAGFGGSVGGMLVASATGFLLEVTGSYLPLFIWAGVSYLIVLAIIHAMLPRLEPISAMEAGKAAAR